MKGGSNMSNKSAKKILKKVGFDSADQVRTLCQAMAVKLAMKTDYDALSRKWYSSYHGGTGVNNYTLGSAIDPNDYELIQTQHEKY